MSATAPKPPTRPQKPPDNRPPNKPPGRYWPLSLAVFSVGSLAGTSLIAFGYAALWQLVA